MSNKIVEIEVFGQKYRIRVKGEEDEKYISLLTSYLDQKMHEVAVKSKSSDAAKIAVLAALNIVDELFLSQKRQEKLEEVMRHMEKAIESMEARLLRGVNGYKQVDEAIK